MTAATEYHFRRGASLERTFKCTLNPKDDCAGSTSESKGGVQALVYGDYGGQNYLKFSIVDNETATTITYDASNGNHYAAESWDCSGSTCSKNFFFFPKNAKDVNAKASDTDLILFRSVRSDDNTSLLTTDYGVKAHQISASDMAGLLANVSDSVNTHYFEGPVANPNWSSEKDPWKATGKDGAEITFTAQWDLGSWFSTSSLGKQRSFSC